MPTDLPDQKTEAILADLLTALDRGDDDRRTALLLRWHWLTLDQEQQAQEPVQENV